MAPEKDFNINEQVEAYRRAIEAGNEQLIDSLEDMIEKHFGSEAKKLSDFMQELNQKEEIRFSKTERILSDIAKTGMQNVEQLKKTEANSILQILQAENTPLFNEALNSPPIISAYMARAQGMFGDTTFNPYVPNTKSLKQLDPPGRVEAMAYRVLDWYDKQTNNGNIILSRILSNISEMKNNAKEWMQDDERRKDLNNGLKSLMGNPLARDIGIMAGMTALMAINNMFGGSSIVKSILTGLIVAVPLVPSILKIWSALAPYSKLLGTAGVLLGAGGNLLGSIGDFQQGKAGDGVAKIVSALGGLTALFMGGSWGIVAGLLITFLPQILDWVMSLMNKDKKIGGGGGNAPVPTPGLSFIDAFMEWVNSGKGKNYKLPKGLDFGGSKGFENMIKGLGSMMAASGIPFDVTSAYRNDKGDILGDKKGHNSFLKFDTAIPNLKGIRSIVSNDKMSLEDKNKALEKLLIDEEAQIFKLISSGSVERINFESVGGPKSEDYAEDAIAFKKIKEDLKTRYPQLSNDIDSILQHIGGYGGSALHNDIKLKDYSKLINSGTPSTPNHNKQKQLSAAVLNSGIVIA